MSSRSTRETPHYGAPLSTPRPGQTTRKRPQVGDRDPNYDPNKKKKKPSSRPAKPPKKPAARATTRRDYRGVDGVVEDAEKGKK